jgi:alkylation response protein AidB-like acyl-CoA dehydrogenase
MTIPLRFEPLALPPEAERLRSEVREFLAADPALRDVGSRSWADFDQEFSRRLGARGWIGMTWPRQYGGQERSALERFVVLEELLAAGAPVTAHWVADRQVGPMLLRYGSEAQRQAMLPRIARGDCVFCIGMSEPDSGSDLASIRTRAEAVDGGWIVNGTKLWTSYAHRADHMVLLCRTAAPTEQNRHGGISQMLVDMKTPGIGVRPVRDLTGGHHFDEVSFQDVFLPAEALVGQEGAAWKQVMHELGYERSGPERLLSSYLLFREFVRHEAAAGNRAAAADIGRLAAHLWTLRRMSLSVAGLLQAGQAVDVEAALVKDLGALLEQETPEVLRRHLDLEPAPVEGNDLASLLGGVVLTAPSFSLRGGTREVLRSIIARGLGLR